MKYHQKPGFRPLYVLIAIALMSFVLMVKKQTTVYLIGDSTIANKEVKAYPETGWGMPFAWFFDSTITVDNRAKNGRSTKSFIDEGLWKPVVENLMRGIMYLYNLVITMKEKKK